MKKNILPVLIINLTLMSGCKWFYKKGKPDKPTGIPLKTLEQQLANVSKEVEEKIAQRNKDPQFLDIQKQIEKKAKYANEKIKMIVQNNTVLKDINDQIVEKRKKLDDKKIGPEEKQKVIDQTKGLIERFKEDKTYKEEIAPLEKEIKELSLEYNKIAVSYNKEIQQLVDKKRKLMQQVQVTKKENKPDKVTS